VQEPTTPVLSDEQRQIAVDEILAGYRARRVQAELDRSAGEAAIEESEADLIDNWRDSVAEIVLDDPTYCQEEFDYVARMGQLTSLVAMYCAGVLAATLIAAGWGWWTVLVLGVAVALHFGGWWRYHAPKRALTKRHASVTRLLAFEAALALVGTCASFLFHL